MNCSIDSEKLRVGCYSEFLNYNNATINNEPYDLTGIYRGCFPLSIEDNSYMDHCSHNPTGNVIRVSCQTCNVSGCNTHTFDSNGLITGPGTGPIVVNRAVNILPSLSIITSGLMVSYMKLIFIANA
ncbi:hypothetical protein HUJ04_007344 [Dendroctonus ponderosae]